jgi:hypothetical protein
VKSPRGMRVARTLRWGAAVAAACCAALAWLRWVEGNPVPAGVFLAASAVYVVLAIASYLKDRSQEVSERARDEEYVARMLDSSITTDTPSRDICEGLSDEQPGRPMVLLDAGLKPVARKGLWIGVSRPPLFQKRRNSVG